MCERGFSAEEKISRHQSENETTIDQLFTGLIVERSVSIQQQAELQTIR